MAILLVDDDSGNAMTLSALLEDEGFGVTTASSCAEARAALADAYRIVLLDQHLGDGLGSELVPVVRTRVPAAKVILMSGSCGVEGIPGGADAQFVKGEPFDQLLGLIRRLAG